MRKRIVVVGAVLVVAVVAIAVGRNGGIEVTTAEVVRDTLSVSIPAEGITRARDRFTVAAPVTGRLTRIDLQPGDLVARGDVLGQIFPAPQDPRVVATIRAEVSAAEARYAAAEAALREAELQEQQSTREVERRRPLLEIGAISRERLEQAELAAVVAEERRQSAEASLESAAAALRGAEARLVGAEATDLGGAPVRVVAPVDGRVLTVPDESERIVVAGSPILELADSDGLEVALDILSEDAVRVASGNRVVIRGWGGEGALMGTVRRVTLVGYTKISALGVEEQRVDVIADLDAPPSSLGTGYRVSGEIVVWKGDATLTVPASALVRASDGWEVFVLDGGRARLRSVAVGQRNDYRAEITEGLEEGEVVLRFPPEALDDGARVRVAS